MQLFNSLGAFAQHLASIQAQQQRAATAGLEQVATAIEATAKSSIGTYQPAVGPFPAWRPLADSTKADRVLKGFSADEPLLRSGELRDSISHEVNGSAAAVGSTSDVMVYQELGTAAIPPRPVLGPAAIRNAPLIKQVLGDALLSGLLPAGHAGAPNSPTATHYKFKV